MVKKKKLSLMIGIQSFKQMANLLEYILVRIGLPHADFSQKILKKNFTFQQNKMNPQKTFLKLFL
jgi:hypothetical protein